MRGIFAYVKTYEVFTSQAKLAMQARPAIFDGSILFLSPGFLFFPGVILLYRVRLTLIVKNLLLLLLLAGASFAWEENLTTGWAGAFDGTATIGNEVALVYDPAGLVSYWGFEEGSGATAYDNTGANNATLYNAPAWLAGKYGGGLLFDGINDYADAGNGASLTIANSLTLEAWVYLVKNASLGNVRAIMDKFGTSQNFTSASS